MIQVNLIAAAHLTLTALRDMKARGGGHIINISSVAGSLPEQGIALLGPALLRRPAAEPGR